MSHLIAPASWERVMLEKPHPTALKYHCSPAKTRGIFKGNQGGATHAAMHDVVWRCLGIHPVKVRNKIENPIRCVSKVKPMGPDDEANQQYVEFRRKFPPELIVKDITARSSVVAVKNPYGGRDYKIDFMASTQDIDAFMSVQRSAYYQDEEIERVKWDESMVRLLKEGGDCTICLTPVKGLDWTYDDIWMRAARVFRSETIQKKFKLPEEEVTGYNSDIECFQWATDDNPVMKIEDIERIFENVVDPDELLMRRYGIFRQASGKIYKLFDKNVHKISFDKYFDPHKFSKYWQYRIIDYHPQKPWYISFIAVTPTHEWFVWNEICAKHDIKTTFDIRQDIKDESLVPEEDELNRCTLIDPLAKTKQPSVGKSVYEDLQSGELGLRRATVADTKNKRGRMEIGRRLKNSLHCRVPFNNENRGKEDDPRFGEYLPTLWFFDNCMGHVEHFEKFRYKQWKDKNAAALKDVPRPDAHEDKYSDYCRNLEFLGAFDPIYYYQEPDTDYKPRKRFQGKNRR